MKKEDMWKNRKKFAALSPANFPKKPTPLRKPSGNKQYAVIQLIKNNIKPKP